MTIGRDGQTEQVRPSPIVGTPDAIVTESATGALADDVIALVEERLEVSKTRVRQGTVRVSTRTETREEIAEVEVENQHVEVTRVPVDREVDRVPDVRVEGDLTIVPVMEERLVVVKQLILKEELHIRRSIAREVVRTPVTLRRQTATVERLDGTDATAVGETSSLSNT